MRREHLPRHSPVSHEEGGVQHLSLLRFMLERHTTCRRRILRSSDLFQVNVATQSQCPPRRISSQIRRWCFVASPVCSTVGAKSLTARSSHKGCIPKSLFQIRVDHIFSWSFSHRKPRINCHLPSCESCKCCSNQMYL